jgi:hypothetical protein
VRLFSNTVEKAFEAFVKVIDRLAVPVLNSHIDSLFDLDLIPTLAHVKPTFNPPGDER